MKKFCLILAAAVMVLSAAACKPDDEIPVGGWRGTVNISVMEAGFGTHWLDEMASAFQKEADVKVNVSKSYIHNEILNQIEGGTSNADIVMPVGNLFKYQHQGLLADLTDVYDAVPKGEDKAVREKMNKSLYDMFLDNKGEIYQMSWANSLTSFVYNKTVLDELFGADGYRLPRTTGELIDFANQIKTVSNGGVYPFTYSASTVYLNLAISTWWAQYEGAESYSDYFNGYYYNESGIRTKAASFTDLDAAGREKSLSVASALFSKSAGYTHQYADTMSYLESQISFLSWGYKNADDRKCAMSVNGDWLENEMQTYLVGKPQDIRMMRMPVISGIVEKLENNTMPEATLRGLIEAIDNGATSFEGVSANDFNKVKAARLMVFTIANEHSIGILKTSKEQTLAKEFLTYLASDKAQAIYAKELGGITQPYGYTPDPATLSPFAQSRVDTFGNNFVPIYTGFSSPLVYVGGFEEFSDRNSIARRVLNGDSAAAIRQTSRSAYSGSTWNTIINLAA
ncbi:hypothetical protein FACS1894211_01950 [Clostridia bacterium]|nr:hypothetical protein FACS1894211_01950 [Clostridia bacterium]